MEELKTLVNLYNILNEQISLLDEMITSMYQIAVNPNINKDVIGYDEKLNRFNDRMTKLIDMIDIVENKIEILFKNENIL